MLYIVICPFWLINQTKQVITPLWFNRWAISCIINPQTSACLVQWENKYTDLLEVAIPQCIASKITKVLASKIYIKVPKVKILMMQNGAFHNHVYFIIWLQLLVH